MLLCCQLGTLTSDSEWAINEGHIRGKLANINFVMDFAAPVAGRVRFVLTVCLSCLRCSLRVLELSVEACSHAAAVEVRRWPPGVYGEWLVYLSPKSQHFVRSALSEFTH